MYYNLINSMSRGGVSLDVNVQAFITANGITNTTYINSLNDLVIYLKANAVFSKIQAWWIFYGDENQSKYNLINPIDTDAGFRLIYEGGRSVSNLGCQFSANGFINTHFIPSLSQTLLSNGTTVIVGTNNIPATNDVIEIGSYNSANQQSAILTKRNPSNQIAVTANGSLYTSTNADSRGVWTGVRENLRTKLYKNTNEVIDGLANGNLPTVKVYIGALNLNSAGGGGYGLSNQRIQQSFCHEGLNSAEVSILHTGLDTFETALGRKTW